jgi:hypothetical protein
MHSPKLKLGFYLGLAAATPAVIIASFVVFNSLFGVNDPAALKSSNGDWKNASTMLGSTQFQDAFMSNFTRSDLLVKAEGRAIAWKFQLAGATPMVAIDFQMPKLCGSLGCLYAIYTTGAKPQLVGRFLLYPEIPSKKPILSVKEDKLLIAQVGGDGKLVELAYKYDTPTSSFIYISRQSLEVSQ